MKATLRMLMVVGIVALGFLLLWTLAATVAYFEGSTAVGNIAALVSADVLLIGAIGYLWRQLGS